MKNLFFTMQTIRAIRTMVMRAYCKPLVGIKIITIASMVQRIVAPRVRNEATRDVKLVKRNQNLIFKAHVTLDIFAHNIVIKR